ncbi:MULTISPECIES: DsbA family protein [Bacillaceae]|uniref:DsbA family protein n=1 Tax=Evansella alkalicola TaxID=745819 RepID=A0ABS6JPQ2_9BACI|nr:MULTISPECIES: thioredoxin domain-containing protein [Bacillaceae]MBU9720076.1 DsbA family protein [Bacillus alkalicola]
MKWVFGIVKLLLILALVVMSGLFLFNMSSGSGIDSTGEAYLAESRTIDEYEVYETIEFTVDRVYLGEESATNEVILVLDYMCPFCKDWLEEVFPKLKDDFIDQGKVKYFSIPQVYLSKQSLALTEFTQQVEETHPERYFELLNRIFADHTIEEWGSEEYIANVSQEMNLSGWEEVELDYDVIRRTRQVTRGLDVDVVPSIYVNGRKVNDMMDYEEIVDLLMETERPPQWVPSEEMCGQDDDDC